jgi:hypothetical protein
VGRFRKAGTVATMGLALSLMTMQCAHASVVLSDNFSASTPQGNWGGDSIFLSIPQPGNVRGQPSVDLVGPGFFQSLAPVGQNAVDLDGSTGSGNLPAGEIQSIQSLALGNYKVQFELAGNLRGAPAQTTQICIGSSCQSLTPLNTQPYTLYDPTFTGVSGQLSFTDFGPSNQQGNLLADVAVFAPGPVPGAGLAGLAALAIAGLYARTRRA